MNKKLKKVVLGGTFDVLHDGHKSLFKKAFKLGEVTIGLTSDVMARKIKKRKIKNFKWRKKELEDFILKEFSKTPKIFKIKNKFGSTLEEDFDYIVVSPATYKTAILINKERKKRNKKPIKIIKIRFVLAEDGKPISATKILKGEMDKRGRLLKKCFITRAKRRQRELRSLLYLS